MNPQRRSRQTHFLHRSHALLTLVLSLSSLLRFVGGDACSPEVASGVFSLSTCELAAFAGVHASEGTGSTSEGKSDELLVFILRSDTP